MIERFDNRQAQVAGAVCFGLFALIGLAMLMQASSMVSGLVFGILSGYLVVRAMGTSNVILHDDEVETRSIVRIRHYALADLERVDVAVGRTGMNGFGREYLVLHRRDGTTTDFKELNAKPSTGHETAVQRAARAINEALHSR